MIQKAIWDWGNLKIMLKKTFVPISEMYFSWALNSVLQVVYSFRKHELCMLIFALKSKNKLALLFIEIMIFQVFFYEGK